MCFLAKVTYPHVICISLYGPVMVDAQVQALSLTPSFPCNDGELRNRVPHYAAFHAARDLLIQRSREIVTTRNPRILWTIFRY
jgi:hypothetical protein